VDLTASRAGEADGQYATRLDRLRTALSALIEEIDELVFDLLQEAAAEGRSARPALERRLTRVRGGLERASRQLEDLGEGDVWLSSP
jgi:ElaB/YqjD/DUF883 family membrane-anchored ribosome-binding protein